MEFEVALDETLHELGLHCLKVKQLEALQAFIAGKDTFVVLPTGYGKSIIYALLPNLCDKIRGTQGSILVCISPLTSIMMDQQEKFMLKGIKAEFVGEAQIDPAVIRKVLQGDLQLLFISPENLLNNKKFRSMLLKAEYKERLLALVIDEVHCIKTWGEDFRVAFSNIGELRSILPQGIPIIALTATATTEIFKAVSNKLSLNDPVMIGLSPNRDNIKYYVEPLPSISMFSGFLVESILTHRLKFPKILIFCHTIAECALLYQAIRAKLGKDFTDPPSYPDYHKFRLVDMYTRASSKEMKKKVLVSCISTSGKLRIVLATTAFSMGIDCPDISNVINFCPSPNVEQYVQETGRAGRNGELASALLLYGRPGKHTQQAMIKYGTNVNQCRRTTLFKHFLFYKDTEFSLPICKCCDICETKCKRTQCIQ